ncbi:hypothetical protein SGLAD_v1c05480 [Spiroplasma gladiatoris]|uniref:Uncharacterized protein n=1 Tax=Spiroplasma gladiatoris TaxID=2143 RepID=A0A4P7AHP8_9MOLU|nr:hypothetical protein [Spiroplasma gladiatoris]QBQ07747.1 hypothetical protein SGLAD_v1c05480 [Spiroplasma gladiatoris]
MKLSFKNLLLTLSIVFSSLFITSILYKENNFDNEGFYTNQNNLNNTNKATTTYNYKDLILDDYNSYVGQNILSKQMFYGRILKYYIANNVTGEKAINDVESIVDTFNGTTSYSKALFMQNLIASTINISAYGASSDNEFFAESFAKWLLTPDDIKNSSWAIINNFYTTVLPELIRNSYSIDSIPGTESKKLIEAAKNTVSKYSKLNEYDLSKSKKDSNPINLNYNSNTSIGWSDKIYSVNAIQGIINRSGINYANTDGLINVLSGWMNDSWTKAGEESINKFNNFNSNHFSSFSELDEKLKDFSLDINGVAQVSPEYLFTSLASYYKNDTPQGEDNLSEWTEQNSIEIRQVFLNLYNYLYSIINDGISSNKNEEKVLNVMTGLVISPDETLVDGDSGTLGYTATSGYGKANNTATTGDSYIVIRSDSLLLKEYHSQYKKGWFSTPEKFNVIVHEMGHALEAYGGKDENFRASSEISKTRTYSSLYKGTYLGGKNPKKANEESTNNFLKIIGIVFGVMAIVIIFVSVITVLSVRKKPKKI